MSTVAATKVKKCPAIPARVLLDEDLWFGVADASSLDWRSQSSLPVQPSLPDVLTCGRASFVLGPIARLRSPDAIRVLGG